MSTHRDFLQHFADFRLHPFRDVLRWAGFQETSIVFEESPGESSGESGSVCGVRWDERTQAKRCFSARGVAKKSSPHGARSQESIVGVGRAEEL